MNRSDLGPSLLVLGGGTAAVGLLLLDSVPALMLGISIMVMGLLAAWGEGEAEGPALELTAASWDNLALLLESLGAVPRAIYLPSSASEDSRPCALVVQGGAGVEGKVPKGFTVRYGPGPADVGLRVRAMGSKAVEACMDAGAVSGDVDATLTNCVVNHLAVARSVEASPRGDGVAVMVRGIKIRNPYEGTMVDAVLGSPMASIVASLVAESLGRPVIIEEERREGRGDATLISVRALGPQ